MVQAARWMLAVGTLLLAFSALAVQAAEGDEMVVNPIYKYWSQFKPGATATRLEKTALTGPDKELVPDGIDEKVIIYKLLKVTPEQVVVQLVVVERGFLNSIESAPTKQISPAKIKKSHLHAGLHGVDPKKGEETLTVMGKELPCVTLSGMEKKETTEVEHKLWLSEKVPGGIVKHTRVTKQDGKLVADTTITLKSYKSED